MTPSDPPDQPTDLGQEPSADELAVHAVLDGEATPEQRRRVAGDPALRTQVTALRAVVDQVAAPPEAPDEAVFDALRAAAVDHLGEPDTVIDLRNGREPAEPEVLGPPPPEDQADAPVTALPDRRARRQWPALPAVAAVIVLLVALGAGLIISDDGDDTADTTAVGRAIDDDATSAGDGGDRERSLDEEAADGGADAEPSPSSTTSGTAESPESSRGDLLDPVADLPDDDALREILQDVDPATIVLDGGPPGFRTEQRSANLSRAGAPEITRCSSVIQSSDATIGAATAATVVRVDGTTLYVLSSPVEGNDGRPGTTLLHAVDPTSCVPRFGVQR